MSIKSKSYAEQVSAAQVMTEALSANLKELRRRGMSKEFIGGMERTLGSIIAKNSEQERLKGELKLATAALEAHLQELFEQTREAVKVVKLALPQTRWVEFGIPDKR